jgi:hypothetical protein
MRLRLVQALFLLLLAVALTSVTAMGAFTAWNLRQGFTDYLVARAQLLDSVHDGAHEVSDRAIDSHVKNIRRKLDEAEPGVDVIESVYGVGYRFDAPA